MVADIVVGLCSFLQWLLLLLLLLLLAFAAPVTAVISPEQSLSASHTLATGTESCLLREGRGMHLTRNVLSLILLNDIIHDGCAEAPPPTCKHGDERRKASPPCIVLRSTPYAYERQTDLRRRFVVRPHPRIRAAPARSR